MNRLTGANWVLSDYWGHKDFVILSLSFVVIWRPRGFPGGLVVRICLQCRNCRRHRFDLWVGKIPWKEGIAPHSGILARRTPWIEEPGGLQFIGSQRVGHDQSDLACIHSWSEYWRVRGVIKLLQNMCPREERNLHLSYILVQSKEPCFLL